MKRTTLRLDDKLYGALKAHAARTGRTLTAVIEDALRQSLASSKLVRVGKRTPLPVFRGDGLMPGVDLDDSRALNELMSGD